MILQPQSRSLHAQLTFSTPSEQGLDVKRTCPGQKENEWGEGKRQSGREREEEWTPSHVWHADDTSHMPLTKHRMDYSASCSLLHSLSSFTRLWGGLDTQNGISCLDGSFVEQPVEVHYKYRKLQSPQGISDERNTGWFSSCWERKHQHQREKKRTQKEKEKNTH